MFRRGNGEAIKFEEIGNVMLDFYEKTKHFDADYQIIIGTDSQNRVKTKVVTVACIVCKGHGGIFFYEVTKMPVIKDVRRKLQTETNESLNLAMRLVELLESDKKYKEMYSSAPLSIHVDAGNSPKGKTAELIPGIIGWINACGYNAEIKPDSFVASSIADKISK